MTLFLLVFVWLVRTRQVAARLHLACGMGRHERLLILGLCTDLNHALASMQQVVHVLSCTLCHGSFRVCKRCLLGCCRVGGHHSLAPHNARAAECLTQPSGCVSRPRHQAVYIAQACCVSKHKACARLHSLSAVLLVEAASL